MLVEPELERIAHHLRGELDRIARDQLVLHLPLELGVEHLHRQHVVDARPDIFGHQFEAALAHGMQVDEVADGSIRAFAQTRHVGATGARRDHVDVALGDQFALGRPRQRPQRTLALGEAVGLGLRGHIALAEERAGHGIGPGDGAGEIAADAFGEMPRGGLDPPRLLDAERELDARQQHRLGAHQRGDVGGDDARRIEIACIGPEADAGAGIARGDLAHAGQRFVHRAVGTEHHAPGGAVALDADFEAGRERIAHAHAHAMQAAGDAIDRLLVGLAELATRVQRGEDDLHRRHLLLGVDVDRNAAAVVAHFGRAVFPQRDGDMARKPGQPFVGRVVDDLDQRMVRVDRIGVHAGPVQDGREILENLDVFSGVGAVFPGHRLLSGARAAPGGGRSRIVWDGRCRVARAAP